MFPNNRCFVKWNGRLPWPPWQHTNRLNPRGDFVNDVWIAYVLFVSILKWRNISRNIFRRVIIVSLCRSVVKVNTKRSRTERFWIRACFLHHNARPVRPLHLTARRVYDPACLCVLLVNAFCVPSIRITKTCDNIRNADSLCSLNGIFV